MSKALPSDNLPAEWTTRSHCWEFVEQVTDDSDRAVAIVAGAVLDEMLRRLLAKVIVNQQIAERLLENYAAPLRTFSARINSSYAFRIIPQEQYMILSTIRDIRNSFAHEINFSFAEPTTATRCQEMNLDYIVYPQGMENDPRTRFVQIASGICGQIDSLLYSFSIRGFDPILLGGVDHHNWRRHNNMRRLNEGEDNTADELQIKLRPSDVYLDLRDQLVDQSERAQAIVAAAALDELLRRILNVVISNDFVADTLVNDLSAPLATFSTRIDTTYAFRIIGTELHQLLHQLRDIRNPFAHKARWSFAKQSTRDKCNNLNISCIQIEDGLKDDPRHRFISHVIYACSQLDIILNQWEEIGFNPQLLVKDT